MLYGVLSHVGNVGSGHYVSYVRPLGQRQWFEFDDTRVSPVSEDVAVRRQFGGGHGRGSGMFGMGTAPNAYMLIYVRQVSRLRGADAPSRYPRARGTERAASGPTASYAARPSLRCSHTAPPPIPRPQEEATAEAAAREEPNADLLPPGVRRAFEEDLKRRAAKRRR